MIDPESHRAYAIIIGAMKCGTTSLYQMLAKHPQICPCSTKEPQFFCKEKKTDYDDLWDYDDSRHTYSLEASTNYTKYPMIRGVPDRIRSYGLNPKFIYLVRDPIDRIESHYNFIVNNRGGSADDFKETRLVACSKYYMQLQQFMEVFPDRDQYLILDFDVLISNPLETVNASVDFLGLEPLEVITEKTSNRTDSNLSDIWIRRTGSLKNKVGGLLTSETRTRIKRWLRRFTPSVKRYIKPAGRDQLRTLIRRDIEQFGNTFSFDVSKWGF